MRQKQKNGLEKRQYQKNMCEGQKQKQKYVDIEKRTSGDALCACRARRCPAAAVKRSNQGNISENGNYVFYTLPGWKPTKQSSFPQLKREYQNVVWKKTTE